LNLSKVIFLVSKFAFFKWVNLYRYVAVMALRPVPHASPTFKDHYAALRDLADERIVLSGLSREQLGNQLLKSDELSLRGVDRIGHTALCFLHERSSGNFKQAMAWMKEMLEDVGNTDFLSRQSSGEGSGLCHRHDRFDDADRNVSEARVKPPGKPPPRPCLVVLEGGTADAEMMKRGLIQRGHNTTTGGSLIRSGSSALPQWGYTSCEFSSPIA
jgi:hypothetical protein